MAANKRPIMLVDFGQSRFRPDVFLPDQAIEPGGKSRVLEDEQVSVEDERVLLADHLPDLVLDAGDFLAGPVNGRLETGELFLDAVGRDVFLPRGKENPVGQDDLAQDDPRGDADAPKA